MRQPKRCPFCGDRPTVKIQQDVSLIQCENQLCDIQPCASDPIYVNALQKWNRRAT